MIRVVTVAMGLAMLAPAAMGQSFEQGQMMTDMRFQSLWQQQYQQQMLDLKRQQIQMQREQMNWRPPQPQGATASRPRGPPADRISCPLLLSDGAVGGEVLPMTGADDVIANWVPWSTGEAMSPAKDPLRDVGHATPAGL